MVKTIRNTIVVAALLSSGAAYGGTPGWQMSEVRGKVTVSRDGIIKAAQSNSQLLPGDVIKTGPKGRAVLLRGKEYLVVSPSSHIQIAQPEKVGKVTQIIEYLGNVLFRIDKKSTPHFGVKTPYLAAVVKGTTFSVSVSEEGSAVQVTEGAVEVATLDDGASQLVTPGVIGMVEATDPFSLTIIDGERQVIESPNKPVELNQGQVRTTSTDSGTGGDSSETNLTGTIDAPVMEEGVELASLTGGFISGDVSYENLVAADAAEAAFAADDTGSEDSDQFSDDGGEEAGLPEVPQTDDDGGVEEDQGGGSDLSGSDDDKPADADMQEGDDDQGESLQIPLQSDPVDDDDQGDDVDEGRFNDDDDDQDDGQDDDDGQADYDDDNDQFAGKANGGPGNDFAPGNGASGNQGQENGNGLNNPGQGSGGPGNDSMPGNGASGNQGQENGNGLDNPGQGNGFGNNGNANGQNGNQGQDNGMGEEVAGGQSQGAEFAGNSQGQSGNDLLDSMTGGDADDFEDFAPGLGNNGNGKGKGPKFPGGPGGNN